MKTVVAAKGLTKIYNPGSEDPVHALEGIDLSVRPGEIFGLIGADGAGKSTVFKILSGVLEPTSGLIAVLGGTPHEVRSQVGYLTQPFSLYEDLSVDENLRYAAGLRDISEEDFKRRRKRYLEAFDLERFGDRLAGRLSGGMKQKLALSCALITGPQLLLLDEPTTGVDPVSRREFWDALTGLAHEGMTIIVATPYLDEAERCTHVALMEAGKVLEVATPRTFCEEMGLTRLELHTEDLQGAEELLAAVRREGGCVADVQRFGDRLDVLVAEPDAHEAEICGLLSNRGLVVGRVRRGDPELENAFVARLRALRGPASRPAFPERSSNASMKGGVAMGAYKLRKRFGHFEAVKGIDVEVRHGEIFGLLGANGAGKTTAIKMICGLVTPTSGKVALLGKRRGLRSAAVRSRIGYKSQKFSLYDDLTIDQNLDLYASLYDVPQRLQRVRKDWALEVSGLQGQHKMLTGRLPDGWKQRVAFAAAVMHEPNIVLLDEPTSGVDALARRAMWRMINELADNGAAVLVVTHYLEEAEQCNRLGFMAAGEIIAQGSPSEVKSIVSGELFEVRAAPQQQAREAIRTALPQANVSVFGDKMHVRVPHDGAVEQAILAALAKGRLDVHHVEPIDFSLEDVFIALIEQKRLAEAA